MSAEGLKTDSLRKRSPKVAEAFALYLMCRQHQVFSLEVSRDGGKRTEKRIARFPVGYHSLPEAGGILDQSNWLIDMFEHFKAGEQTAANKTLSR